MILPRKGRVPPTDGQSHWRFPVAPGVMIRAKGHQELMEAVFEYRLRNNQPIGDIERDISDFYCRQYPKLCNPEPRDYNPEAASVSVEPMLNRVSRWASVLVHRIPRGGYELVPKAESEARAAICAACPKQEAGWKGGCGGCSASTLQLLQQLKKMRMTSKDGNLGACTIAGWGNLVAIHLTTETLAITAEQRAAMPDACWRKTL